MQEALISAIIMAIITALAWIAYNHPKSYAKIFPVLAITWACCFFAVGGYRIGYAAGFDATISETSKLNLDSLKVILPKSPSPSWAYPLWFLGIQMYGMILRFLPQILNLPSENRETD
jgi:hypothetical protein